MMNQEIQNFVDNLSRVAAGQLIRSINKSVNNLISYFYWNKKNNSETHNSGSAKETSQITVYRSKFQVKQAIGAELWHASVHVVINGKSEIWKYGRYDGIDGKPWKKRHLQDIRIIDYHFMQVQQTTQSQSFNINHYQYFVLSI